MKKRKPYAGPDDRYPTGYQVTQKVSFDQAGCVESTTLGCKPRSDRKIDFGTQSVVVFAHDRPLPVETPAITQAKPSRADRRAARVKAHKAALGIIPQPQLPATEQRPYHWVELADGTEAWRPIPDSQLLPASKGRKENVRGFYNGRGRAGNWRVMGDEDGYGRNAPIRVPWTKADVTR